MLGQLIAIALVIAAGVMVLVISMSTRQSIEQSQQHFYQQYHFADVFVEVTRAPDDLIRTIRQLPGVNVAETRIRAGARFQLEGPVNGFSQSLCRCRLQELCRADTRRNHFPTRAQS